MKQLYTFFILISFFASAQIPTGYYNSATGSGFTLKTQLHNIIKNSHNPQEYNTHWSFFEANDVLSNGKVWDIYANCNFNFGTPNNGGNQDVGTGGNAECQFFNREHTFPTSWFGNIEPARSDIMQVLPADKKVNNERGNLPYGLVSSAIYTSTNGTKRGSSSITAVSGQVFEVIDEFKGDIARIFFYMATRYQDLIDNWENLNADGDKMLDGSTNKVFEQWALDMLYQWHIQDPVSQKEIDRNNAAYNYQSNRNPYVDQPQWVTSVWGNNLSANQTDLHTQNLQIYPNPSNQNSVSISSNIDITEIIIYNSQGQKVFEINNIQNKTYQLTTAFLKQGIYFVKTNISNQTQKLIIN